MPILAFHNCSPGLINGFNNYSPNRFENLLNIIKENGFEFVGLNDYIDAGRKNNEVVLTFDDGYETFIKFVFPIIKKMEIAATIFIPTDFIGKANKWDYAGSVFPSRHLSQKQLIELSKNNMTIASHGLAHRCLTQLSGRLLKMELERSKKILEDIINRKISFISYPFGRFNHDVESVAAEAGYRNGFSLSLKRKGSTGFTMSRFAVYAFDTPFSVLKKLNTGKLNGLERIKGSILNAYAGGTIFFNNLRGHK